MEATFESNGFKVHIITEGLKERENALIYQAAQLMANVIGDPAFKVFCENYKYEITKTSGIWPYRKKWKETIRGFWHNQNKSGLEIHNHLMTGAEKLNGEIDNEADINLRIDRSFGRRCIGYTYKNSIWQYLCQWVFSSYGPENIASNLAHEWCHKMGYSHEYKKTSRRKYSVPYAVGDYVEYICKKNNFKKKVIMGLMLSKLED